MKKVGQIRENYNILTEKDDAEMRKLTSLVRAGLFDSKKLPMLKRALNKDPKDMTTAERKILIELLDSLMGEVLGSQQVFQKVKQDVMKEELSEAKTSDGYLSKYDPRYDKMPSEKQIPTIIILKRKAIRIYPDNQKVALYYSQALDKYVTIPFGTFEGGSSMNEEVEYFSESRTVESMSARDRFKSKRKIQEEDKDNPAKKIASEIGDAALDMTPGVGTIRSGQRTIDAYKQGDYGQAAIHGGLTALSAAGDIALVGATPLGLGIKALVGAAGRKLAAKVAAGEASKKVSSSVNKAVDTPKTPETPKAPEAKSGNVLDNLPGVNPSKTPPEASNANTPKVETPKAKAPAEELPIPSSSGGKGKPVNTNDAPEIKGTGTTGPAPKLKTVDPVRKDSYNTGVQITKGAPAGKTPANINIATPSIKSPVSAPSVKTSAAPAKSPANVNAPAAKPAAATANAPANAAAKPAVKPATKAAAETAPVAKPALKRKTAKTSKPLILPPFSLPDANINKDLRDPAKFSLAAHISKPKGNVRTGVQKREENMFRKSLQNEEAPEVSYKRKVDPAKFGNIRVSTNRPSGNTDVRTGVSARDAMMYRRSLQQNEDVLTKLKNVTEGQNLHLTLGDDSVIINKTVANKILTVYESVSKENKKKIEDMLNESVDSVKKIINFVARQ